MTIDARPSPWFILIRSRAWAATALFVGAAWWWGSGPLSTALDVPRWPRGAAIGTLAGLLALRLGWAWLEWLSRRYTLRDGVVGVRSGVLRRSFGEVRAAHVRTLALDRLLIERVVRVGSIGVGTAGTGGFDVVWLHVGRPRERLAAIRAATEAAS